MLSHLSISNYVLIDKLSIDFQSGFSVITGETGAGKSIMLGALGLILGNRAEKNVVLEDRKKCVIEARFKMLNLNLESFFLSHDLDFEDVCILRREITASGKSRAFVNDTPVKLPIMKLLGDQLIDVHSQNQNQQLTNATFRIGLLDAYANHKKLLINYKESFEKYHIDKKNLVQLKSDYTKQLNEQEYYQFLFDELEKANIKNGEQKEIEDELLILNNAEEIKLNLFSSAQEISNSDSNVVSKLQKTIDNLSKISSYNNDFKNIEDRIQSVFIELKDIGNELDALDGDFHFDPARLEFINERLNVLYSLSNKHGFNTADELLEYQNKLSEKIYSVVNLEREIEIAEKALILQKGSLEKNAESISGNRKQASAKIKELVLVNLKELGMPGANLEIQFEELEELAATGKDKIVILFKANASNKMAEINKVASGGEMSRIMLSFKNVLALKKALPTIVFDEIDAGVSGEIAEKLANVMKSLGKSLQVISISHLPQIASKANHHYLVYKENESTFTRSNMKKLSDQERTKEIAAMLSGSNVGDSALHHAKELLGS